MTDLYCMSCVPLRPGVWSIALLQVPKHMQFQGIALKARICFIFTKAMYSGVRIYLARGVEDQLRHIIVSST